jgi:hypothetical protein
MDDEKYNVELKTPEDYEIEFNSSMDIENFKQKHYKKNNIFIY